MQLKRKRRSVVTVEIAALVLGIIGLVGSFIPIVNYSVGFICGLLAIIFGAIGVKKETPNKTKAKIGLILGIITLVIGLITVIACTAGITYAAQNGAFDDILNNFN